MNKKHIKLYNLIFPIWFLILIPYTWVIVLPANFIIDLTVCVLTMKFLKVESIKEKVKSVIAKVWLLGFASDFIGTAIMLLSKFIGTNEETPFGKWWYTNILQPVNYNPFENIYGIVYVTICVIIAAAFIYIFNYKISFKKLDVDDAVKKKLSLSLAICTAPYLFYLPTAWFFYR